MWHSKGFLFLSQQKVWAEYVLSGAVVIIPITVACSVYGSMNAGGLSVGRWVILESRS